MTLLIYRVYENVPRGEGDCVPMSCDGGKTWCYEYDYIQAHPEKEWKTWLEILYVKVDDNA